jgi:hypothetical protein
VSTAPHSSKIIYTKGSCFLRIDKIKHNFYNAEQVFLKGISLAGVILRQ